MPIPKSSDDHTPYQSRERRKWYCCPLCGQKDGFVPYRKRPMARCLVCAAKERARLMALIIKKLKLRSGGLPVYHFAPETGISLLLQQIYGDRYRAADLFPENYPDVGVPVNKVDLTAPLESIPAGSCGGLIHSHVLEHIPVSLDRLITELNATLAPGGFHIFQAPVHAGWYREDMDPNLDSPIRTERFYQDDHMRAFGIEDFQSRVLDLFRGFDQVELSSLVTPEELTRGVIPSNVFSEYTSHSVFVFVKHGRLPVVKPWIKNKFDRFFGPPLEPKSTIADYYSTLPR